MKNVNNNEKLYSRKEMLKLTGKSITGIAVATTLPTLLAGCSNDSKEESGDSVSANTVADKDVVFTPDKEVCSSEIRYSIKDGKITNVEFDGGCDGNLQGIAQLAEGMTPEEAANKIAGIRCSTGGELRNSSCPDQFSKALLENI